MNLLISGVILIKSLSLDVGSFSVNWEVLGSLGSFCAMKKYGPGVSVLEC